MVTFPKRGGANRNRHDPVTWDSFPERSHFIDDPLTAAA
jgi:hypothetical protein